jgi:hypothetical protein
MNKEREERLKKELTQIDEERIKLEADLKICKKNRDKPLEEQILRKLGEFARRVKRIRFNLGLYKYPADERVEVSPREFVDANTYFRLIDDD